MKKVAVFCGSRTGSHPEYLHAATQLGELLARHQLGLVYGGSDIGLMGQVASSVLAHGGQVIGVIPGFMKVKEIAKIDVTELIEVSSMHERKTVMYERSHGFAILPGGIGTLDELCEVMTWFQLGLHQKPIVMINTHGIYDHFRSFLDTLVEAGFFPAQTRDKLYWVNTPGEAIPYFLNAPSM